MEEETEYSGYNSLHRKAVIVGIPVPVFVLGLFLVLITSFVSIITLGIKGVVFPLMIIGVLLIIRAKCMEDPNALDSFLWITKIFYLRLLCKSKIISYAALEITHNRKVQNASEWFKNNPDI